MATERLDVLMIGTGEYTTGYVYGQVKVPTRHDDANQLIHSGRREGSYVNLALILLIPPGL